MSGLYTPSLPVVVLWAFGPALSSVGRRLPFAQASSLLGSLLFAQVPLRISLFGVLVFVWLMLLDLFFFAACLLVSFFAPLGVASLSISFTGFLL
jgi:hypothetical protein